jgi:hypothetical protein
MTDRVRRQTNQQNSDKITPEQLNAVQTAMGETPVDTQSSTESITPVTSVDQKPQNQESPAGQDTLSNIETLLEQNPVEFNASMSDATPKKMDILPREQINKIIKLFADKSDCTVNLAVIGITALVQGGGSNASMPPITRVINGKKFDLKTLRECVAFATEKKGTVRQMAKTMRNIIYKIALQNGWLGPLAITLKKDYPEAEFTTLDLIFAAEFHEDNMEPYMPPKVREALVDRAQKLRAAKLQPQKPKQKKKGGKNKKNR